MFSSMPYTTQWSDQFIERQCVFSSMPYTTQWSHQFIERQRVFSSMLCTTQWPDQSIERHRVFSSMPCTTQWSDQFIERHRVFSSMPCTTQWSDQFIERVLMFMTSLAPPRPVDTSLSSSFESSLLLTLHIASSLTMSDVTFKVKSFDTTNNYYSFRTKIRPSEDTLCCAL